MNPPLCSATPKTLLLLLHACLKGLGTPVPLHSFHQLPVDRIPPVLLVSASVSSSPGGIPQRQFKLPVLPNPASPQSFSLGVLHSTY